MNQSENLNELFAALAKAQSEMQVAELSKVNPHFKSKYADLESIIKASRPALVKNGLCVIQQMETVADASYFVTKICHTSGQWMSSTLKISPTRTDIQSLGSYLTYLRRYMYASLVGVVSGEDDDGEVAIIPQTSSLRAPQKNTVCVSASKEQIEQLENALIGQDLKRTNMLNFLKVSSFDGIDVKLFDRLLKSATEKKEEK